MQRYLQSSSIKMVKCSSCGKYGINPTKYYSQYNSAERKEVKIWGCIECNEHTLKIITK